MSRINTYPEADSLNQDDFLVIDGATDGTRRVKTDKVGPNIHEFKDALLVKTKLAPSTSASNWALNNKYLSVSDTNAIIYKYEVNAGEEIYLNVESYGECTAIFQTDAYIPSSGTNNKKRGDAIIGRYSDYITVPDEAAFLIIAQSKSNNVNAVYTLSFTNAIEEVFGDLSDSDLFSLGGINISTGVLTYASAVTFMTENFLAEDILTVTPNNGYYVAPFAYSHGAYIGCWNGSIFSKSSQSYIKSTVDFRLLRETYPDYQWKILVGRLSSSYPVDTIRPNIIFNKRNLIKNDDIESYDVDGFLNQLTFKRGSSGTDNLVLLHFSDIHGNQDRLKNIVKFSKRYSGYINDVLDTGDDVSGQFSDGLTWWDDVDGSESILRCIGNHDAVQSQSDPSNILDMATLAGSFFTPYVQYWGSVNYSANTTYYYKDYDNGVRLIVLDCMHSTDSAQLSWLQACLTDAKENYKHVVIGYHYPVYPYTSVDSCFTPLVSVTEDAAGVTATILQMVHTFQNNGGNFVCYLSGHEHHDRIMVSEEYPNQLCINITCASNVYAQYKNGDQSRYGKTFANAFNLVVVNPNDRVVVVKRIGADMDVLGRDRSSMGYDYGQHRKLYG